MDIAMSAIRPAISLHVAQCHSFEIKEGGVECVCVCLCRICYEVEAKSHENHSINSIKNETAHRVKNRKKAVG